MSDRLVRLAETLSRTGLSRSTLYRLEAAGTFPHRVKLGQRSVAWHEAELRAWIESREIAASRHSEAA